MDGLRCIDDFTTKCLDEDHRAYFNTLYTGTTQVIMDLCKTGEYQTEYLKHARCMRNAQTEYESCVDIYQLRIKSLNKVSFRNAHIVDIVNIYYRRERSLPPRMRRTMCRCFAAASSVTSTAASRWSTPLAAPTPPASPSSSWTGCRGPWCSSTASTTSTGARCAPTRRARTPASRAPGTGRRPAQAHPASVSRSC